VAVVDSMIDWRRLFRTSPRRTALAALAMWVPLALIALWLYSDLYTGRTAPAETDHAVTSFNIAANASFCSAPSTLSTRYSLKRYLADHPELTALPLREVIARQAGSMTEYCRSVVQPVIINDNSLMWLMRLAIGVNPAISHDGLARFLGATAATMTLVFGFALLYAGASWALALGATLVACAVLRSLGVRDTLYPFVLALPLFGAALCGIAYCSRQARELRTVALIVFAAGMGVVVAFSTIMRPIMLPSLTLMFAVFLFATLRRAWPQSREVVFKVTGGMAAAFVVGFLFYTSVFVRPPRAAGDAAGSQYVYHTFAHPLVLGLAVPENDFSRREGIAWNDELGIVLARRAIPDTTYLGATYERALLRYYWNLWREHAGEMTRVYLLKLQSTADDVFLSAAGIGHQFLLPQAPFRWLNRLTSGPILFALVVVVFVAAIRRFLVAGDAWMLLLAFVTIAASLSLVEGFLTYSLFVGNAFSPLLFFLFFAGLVTIQVGVEDWSRHREKWLARFDLPLVKAIGRTRVAEGLRIAFIFVAGLWLAGAIEGALIVTAAYGLSRVVVRPWLALAATLAFAAFAAPPMFLRFMPIGDTIELPSPRNSAPAVMRGLSAYHDSALGITDTSYSLEPLVEEGAAVGDLIAAFPADLLTRMYAAVGRVTTLPFVEGLDWLALAALVLAPAILFADRRRAALAVIVALVFLAAMTGLAFWPKWYVPLEILPFLAIAVVVDRLLSSTTPFNFMRASRFVAMAIVCVAVPLITLRFYQRDSVRRLFRSYLTSPKTTLPMIDTKGALYPIGPPPVGQVRILELDFNRWQCADKTTIEFFYDHSKPDADYSQHMPLPGSSATHSVLRLFAPVTSPAFQGLLLPQAAGCLAGLSVMDRPRAALPAAVFDRDWEHATAYQRTSVEARLFR
jgi:hypothetical protein